MLEGNSATVACISAMSLLRLRLRNEMNGRSASQRTRKWRTRLGQLYRARCALSGQWDAERAGACTLSAGTASAPGSCCATLSACARGRVSSPARLAPNPAAAELKLREAP